MEFCGYADFSVRAKSTAKPVAKPVAKPKGSLQRGQLKSQKKLVEEPTVPLPDVSDENSSLVVITIVAFILGYAAVVSIVLIRWRRNDVSNN